MKTKLIYILFLLLTSLLADDNNKCDDIPNVYETIECYQKENKVLLLKLNDLNNSQTNDFKNWNLTIKQKCEKLDRDGISSLQGAGIGLVKLSCYNKIYKNRLVKLSTSLKTTSHNSVLLQTYGMNKTNKVKYFIQENKHGAVLTDREGYKIYMGKDCDVMDSKKQKGSWYKENDQYIIKLGKEKIEFNFSDLNLKNYKCIQK